MTHVAFSFAAALALAGCATQPDGRAAARAAEDERALAAALAGRSPGHSVSCVDSRLLGGQRSFGSAAILFEGTTRSSPVYVNRPAAGCPAITIGRALKSRRFSSRMCSGDIVTVFDPSSGIEYGSCALGDFTPYDRE